MVARVAAVSFRGVAKQFGSFEALRGIDLEVRDGEFLVLVGPSGSGKTTTLRLLAGLERPTEGTIQIGSRVVNDVAAADRDIAMVFQSYALYPHMTVRQNLEYGLKRRKVPRDQIRARVTEAVGLLGLHELLERHPSQLSGGQAQRVAVCRALIRDPAVFLMDEPLSNLDAKLRSHARAEIKRVQAEAGVTTVYVTHDQVEAMTMGDRIAVINHGLIAQCDTPEALYRRPADSFVAGFIGSPAMNLFAALVEGTAGQFELHAFGIEVRGTAEASATLARGTYTIGVRPEDLRVYGGPSDGWLGPIPGRLTFVEDLGRERFIYVEVGGTNNLTVQADSWGREVVGDRVEVFCRVGGMHVFDADGQATAHLGGSRAEAVVA
jgi:ABC-type sugar transport system ATPase subunit